MKKLFWGFFFVYLNFNLNLNEHSINILPGFVGWLLIVKGMDILRYESAYFERPRPFAIALAVYEAILWVGNILAVTSDNWVGTILGLISTAASFYVTWLLVQGVRETEQTREADLGSAVLFRRWKWLLGVQVAVRLLGFMANLSNISVLVLPSLALIVVSLVVIVQFLMDWNRTAKAYEALAEAAGGEEER